MSRPPLDRVSDLLHTGALAISNETIKGDLAGWTKGRLDTLNKQAAIAKKAMEKATKTTDGSKAAKELPAAAEALALTIIDAHHLLIGCFLADGKQQPEALQAAYGALNKVTAAFHTANAEDSVTPPNLSELFNIPAKEKQEA